MRCYRVVEANFHESSCEGILVLPVAYSRIWSAQGEQEHTEAEAERR